MRFPTLSIAERAFSRFAGMCALLAVQLASSVVFAHAIVVESVPADGAALPKAPSQIELRFNVRVEQALTRAALITRNSAPVPLTVVRDSAPRAERVVIAVPSLEPGEYEVRYKVLAMDGHATQGVLHFRVAP